MFVRSMSVCVSVAALTCGVFASAEQYTIVDLGALPGQEVSRAYAINEAGDVAGTSDTAAGDPRAFLYVDNALVDLGTLGGTSSWAYDVNAARQVVGRSFTGAGYHAFLYDQGGIVDLGTLGGDVSSAKAINDAGQVVGYAYLPGNDYHHAFSWQNGQGTTDLDTLGGGSSTATDVNNSGQIVGQSSNGVEMRAVSWMNGEMCDLGVIPGGHNSAAVAINEAGQIAGFSHTAEDENHAVIWEVQPGCQVTMTDLGVMDGRMTAFARDINNLGEVVGQSGVAFLWQSDEMLDLNQMIPPDSGWVLEEARAINDVGQIVGIGTLNGVTHGFLLLPGGASPTIIAAGSCRIHDAGGPNEANLCIDLIAGNGVEPRRGGPKQITVTFSEDLDISTVTAAHVQVDCANQIPSVITVRSGGPADPNVVLIDFASALADDDCCRFAFGGMLSVGGAPIVETFNVIALQGDVNFSGAVTGGDAVLIKPHFGELLGINLSALQWDFDRNGAVTGADYSLIKPQFGDTAPACP